MNVFKCKGMTDLLPGDMVKFRRVEEVFRSSCLNQGYKEIRTPTLEYLHLFTAIGTLTPSMLGRVYSFLDWDGWSGERVVLRPDGTIPAVRLYLENLERANVTRLFYVENAFTFEETGKERRERWQCGAEVIGSSQPLADVELLLLATEVLMKLGVGPLKASLSHAGLIKALLAELELGAAEQEELYHRVLEGDFRALRDIKTRKPDLSRALALLLDVKGDSPGFLENVRALLGRSRARFSASLDNLTSITELLSAMGCSYEIDIACGRGFEYYTGLIFQINASDRRVGGGGRYDDLIPLVGGPAIPASGFALYVDRLMDLLQTEPISDHGVLVKPESADVSTLKAVLEMTSHLRDTGYVAEIDLGRASPSDYRWIVSVAEDGTLRLVDRSTGKKSKAASGTRVIKLMEESK